MLLTFYRKIMIYNRIYLLLFGADTLILNRPNLLIKSGSSYWKDSSFSLNQKIVWSEITDNIMLASIFNSQSNAIFAVFLKTLLTDDERLKFHPKVLKMLTSVFSQEELKTMVHAEKTLKTSICETLEHYNYEKTIIFLKWVYFNQIEDEKTKQRVFKRFKITKDMIQEFSQLNTIPEDYLNDNISRIIPEVIPSTYNILSKLKQEDLPDNE
jgi:hypothetical protein